MLQNAPFKKKIFGEACPRTPLVNAWLRQASQAPPPKKKKKKIVGPLGKSCRRKWPIFP